MLFGANIVRQDWVAEWNLRSMEYARTNVQLNWHKQYDHDYDKNNNINNNNKPKK